MDKHDFNSLNELYRNADTCDEEVFSEMRSNLLLVSGNHYTKKSAAFFSRVRNSQKLNETQKLRITKNHIHKITRYYHTSVLRKIPGVAIKPKDELDLQSKKQAQLNASVWQDAKERYNLKETIREFASNFVEIGEVCCLLTYNPNIGELKGYDYLYNEETGEIEVDEMTGEPKYDQSKPIFTGGFEFKNIPGYSLLRAPSAKNMKTSPYHIIREMVDPKELKLIYGNDPEKLKAIGEGDPDPFIVFDTNKAQYRTEDNQILVKTTLFRPCKQYPSGYFFISTERGILEEGEIPYGIYPLKWEGFDTFSSNPRGYSIVKVARPFQAEINRASSQAATHQITVGDDKIIYQGGTKLAPGALLPGVRGITYQGAAPQILAGRSGEQFLPYIQAQISEMYDACMLDEIMIEKQDGQIDPYALLFKAGSAEEKFGQYTAKFENFLKEVCFMYLEMAKHYLPDDALIYAIGKNEAINIQEFRSTTPLCYQIIAEEQPDNINDRMGRQLALNHILQFAGQQLDPKHLGLLFKEMPFLNNNAMIKRLSLDFENVENDMLQLERGQMPFVSPYADNQIYVESLTHRMKQPDFNFLPPQVKQMYDEYLGIHEEQIKAKMEAQQAAKDGFIPTGGALITVSMQVPDASSQSGSRQVRLPYEAVMHLIQKLEAQGSSLQALEQMNGGAVVDMQNRGQQQSPQASQISAMPGQQMPA